MYAKPAITFPKKDFHLVRRHVTPLNTPGLRHQTTRRWASPVQWQTPLRRALSRLFVEPFRRKLISSGPARLPGWHSVASLNGARREMPGLRWLWMGRSVGGARVRWARDKNDDPGEKRSRPVQSGRSSRLITTMGWNLDWKFRCFVIAKTTNAGASWHVSELPKLLIKKRKKNYNCM